MNLIFVHFVLFVVIVQLLTAVSSIECHQDDDETYFLNQAQLNKWGFSPNITIMINLNDRMISKIEPNTFLEYQKLTQLYMRSNRLKQLEPHTFKGLLSLQYLYLEDNQNDSLDAQVIMPMTSLRQIFLTK